MRFQKSAIFDHLQAVRSGLVVLSISDKKTAKKIPGSRRSRKKIFLISKIFSLKVFTCAAGHGRS